MADRKTPQPRKTAKPKAATPEVDAPDTPIGAETPESTETSAVDEPVRDKAAPEAPAETPAETPDTPPAPEADPADTYPADTGADGVETSFGGDDVRDADYAPVEALEPVAGGASLGAAGARMETDARLVGPDTGEADDDGARHHTEAEDKLHASVQAITPPVLAAVAVGSAVIGALTAGLFGSVGGPGAAPTGDPARLAAVEQRLDDLARAGAGAAGGEAASVPVAALRADIDAVQQAVTDVRAQLSAVSALGGAGGEGADSAALADLVARVDEAATAAAAARRVAEEAAAAPAAQAAAMTALEARLDTVSDALSAQKTAIDQVADATSALAGRMTGVPTTGVGLSGAAAAIAFANLQDAVDAGRPFVAELEEARARFPANQHVTALEGLAAQGAPTPAMLAARFRTVARDSVAADRGAGGGLVDRFERAMTGVVTVRRLDAPETAAAGDIMARAQARLAEDDLAGAVSEVRRLQGQAADVADVWRQDAERRLAVNRHLEALRDSAIAG